MGRTIVNIMSEQVVPNYLFIKEKFLPGDKLMFISSKKFEKRYERIVETLSWSNVIVKNVVLANDGDEENWSSMSEAICKDLSDKEEYIVNLTGGTKYMALAIEKLFSKYNSHFYYIPYPKNVIIGFKSNDNITSIQCRIGISEYMQLHGIKTKEKNITQSKEYTWDFYTLFISNLLREKEYIIIDKLRSYRNFDIDILKVEQCVGTEKKPCIPGLAEFVKFINFPSQKDGFLSHHEIQYITGGWFEEHIYNIIEDGLEPNDIKIGVEIIRTENTNQNDLDVVFTKGNKLFVVECKTGIKKPNMGVESSFKEIAYKATALKEILFGLSANSYIFSLAPENEKLTEIARNMGVVYCDRGHFEDFEKTLALLNSINVKSYD